MSYQWSSFACSILQSLRKVTKSYILGFCSPSCSWNISLLEPQKIMLLPSFLITKVGLLPSFLITKVGQPWKHEIYYHETLVRGPTVSHQSEILHSLPFLWFWVTTALKMADTGFLMVSSWASIQIAFVHLVPAQLSTQTEWVDWVYPPGSRSGDYIDSVHPSHQLVICSHPINQGPGAR